MKNFSVILLFLCVFCVDNAIAGNLLERWRDRHNAIEKTPSSGSNQTFGRISLPANVRVLSDLAYGDHQRQRMDVYLPNNINNAAVIFMVHGGAWRIGDKTAQRVVQNKLNYWAPQGVVFISVNYRLVPDAYPLDQAQDIAAALVYAQANTKKWGADPAKFILMGHSAGAHLVSLLAAKPSLALSKGAQPWLGTVALDSAAFDIVQIMQGRHYGFYDDAFGKTPDYWRSVSPLHVLSVDEAKFAAPLMAICSTQRRDKPCSQAEQFAKAAKALGIRVEILPQNKSHGEINSDLGLPGVYTERVEKFISSL
jgi:acetyl esterase/lipase